MSSHGQDVLITGSNVTFNGANIVAMFGSIQQEFDAVVSSVASLLEEEQLATSEIIDLLVTVCDLPSFIDMHAEIFTDGDAG